MKKYLGVILGTLLLIPIYHLPIFMLTIMMLTGIIQEIQVSIVFQYIIFFIGTVICICIHSIPNVIIYILIPKIIKKNIKKDKFIFGESLIILLIVVVYLILFIGPLL